MYCFPLSFSLCFGAFGSRASRDPLGRICMSFSITRPAFVFFHQLVVLDVFFQWPFCPSPPVTILGHVNARFSNPWISRSQISEPLAISDQISEPLDIHMQDLRTLGHVEARSSNPGIRKLSFELYTFCCCFSL